MLCPGVADQTIRPARPDEAEALTYRAVGAVATGEISSSIPGRSIPTFRFALP
jgi:hypothetical protein